MKKTQIKLENITYRSLTPPILLERVLRLTIGVVNAAFLSSISRSAVTAVNVANQYISVCQIIATAIASASIICLNQAVGMENQRNVDKYATIAFFANLLLGVFFGLVFLCFSGPFLSIMSFETEQIRHMADTYMRVVGAGMMFQCLQMAICSIARSVGLTRVPLLVSLLSNGINVLGCYLVVNGHLLAALDPILGVALCNITAQVLGLLLGALCLRTVNLQIHMKMLKPFPLKDIKLAVSLAIPAGANNIAYSLSQIVTSSIISRTSQLMFDAKSYISSVVGYVAMIGMSYSDATTIILGNQIGAGDMEATMRIRKRGTLFTIIANAVCSVVLLLTYRWIFTGLYGGVNGIDEIISVAGIILLIDFVVEIGRALNVSISGALQAVGDIRYQLIVNQFSAWVIAVGGAYLFGIVFNWSLYGIWLSFALDEMTRGLIILRRWYSKKWVKQLEENIKIVGA